MKQKIQKIKGVSKVVVKEEISHSNYLDIINEKEATINKDVTTLRSFNHQTYTLVQNNVALIGFYDKMKMIKNIDNEPYGFNPL